MSDAADGIANRNICLELLHEMFMDLPEKDRSILGRFAGIFGYRKQKLQEIALEEILTEDGVVKARKAAIRRIKDNYPASKLELWRKVYWLVKNTHRKSPFTANRNCFVDSGSVPTAENGWKGEAKVPI